MNPVWTTGKIITVTVSVIIAVAGIKFLWDAHRHAQRFEEWMVAKPVDMVVDASKPGEFTAPFYQTCSSSHGAMVGLRLSAESLQSMTATQLLAGLEAHLEIRERSGTSVVDMAESDIHWQSAWENGVIPIFSVNSFKRGTYEAKFTVITGAPALANLSQRLEGGYMLCGLEMMPAMIGRIIGGACFVFGTALTAVVLFLIHRDRKKLIQPVSSE